VPADTHRQYPLYDQRQGAVFRQPAPLRAGICGARPDHVRTGGHAGTCPGSLHLDQTGELALPSIIFKANDATNSITIPYNSSVVLVWTATNATRCSASGDWYGIFSASGSQSIDNLTESKKFILTCTNDSGQTASSSVTINIDENTIPQAISTTSTISIRDLFGDFRYFWKKDLYLGMENDPDVTALQTVLLIEELLSSTDQITGNFDEVTFEAVKKFQENYGIESTGYVGTKTIAKLNELYGNYDITFYPSAEQPAPQISSSPQQILGPSFQINDAVVNINTSILRDNNCNQIAVLPPNTSMVIISNAIRFCNIGGKNYQMRNVRVISTGQVGWIASFLLKKVGVFTTVSPTSTTPTGPKPTVDLKVENSDGPITLPYNINATLSWTSSNAKTCTAHGDWSGEKSFTGSEPTGNLTAFKYYSLTCTNNSGFSADSVIVHVATIQNEFDDNAGDTSPLAPKITDFNPKFGPTGMVILIKGKNFAPHDNELHVDKLGVIKGLSSDDGKTLKFVIGGASGNYPVKFYIKNDRGRSNSETFWHTQ